MILSSFQYDYKVLVGNSTRALVEIQLDFSALYQINPDKLIVLKYASINLLRFDASGAAFTDSGALVRLIGKFNETRNIVATIVSAPRTTESIIPFDGISFNEKAPFVAPESSQILMPPTFQLDFRIGTFVQTVANDSLICNFTIGYDLVHKHTRF